MIDADLAVVDAAELVTVAGPAPRLGGDLREVGVIKEGCLAAHHGIIVFVGDTSSFRRQVTLAPDAVTLDASGCIVLPGFVDPHTHLPFAGWRAGEFVQRLRGATYETIAAQGGGISATVTATRKASEDDLVADALKRLDRMLLHGTTTVEAKSGYGLTLDDELKQLRAVRRLDEFHPIDLVPTFLGAHVVPPERRADRDGYVQELVEVMIPQVVADGLARFCDVFVEDGAFNAREGERVLTAAAGLNLGLRVHADQRTACGGAELAARLRAASADHLDRVTDEGIAALAEAGSTAVLLPGASFFLRDADDAPARRLIDAGVPVALATDFNPGTSPTEALAAILPFASVRLGMEPAEAITAATLNAAHSLGLADRIGSLEKGKVADLQIADVPDHRHLSYRFGVNRCRDVVKRGRVVVRAGRMNVSG
jgi:imidazolonepropionase